MMFIYIKNNSATQISEEYPQTDWAKNTPEGFTDGWISSRDVESFKFAKSLAEQISQLTNETYVGSDRGSNTYPRFDIVRAPMIGDEVSYAFNGDCYPDGTIVKISPTYQVTTSTGNVYRKPKSNPNCARWTQAGGTWSLVMGHHFEQNAEF